MTRVDLEAVERLLNEATPGPWTSVYDATSETGDAPPCGTEWLVRSPTRAVLGVAYYDGDRAMGSEPDCALVAAAPTLIRALIEEVRGLREAMPTDEERIAVAEARQQGQRWLSALTEATKDLAQVYEAIGPAWFHGDVSAAEASRRKTEALERLARGPS